MDFFQLNFKDGIRSSRCSGQQTCHLGQISAQLSAEIGIKPLNIGGILDGVDANRPNSEPLGGESLMIAAGSQRQDRGQEQDRENRPALMAAWTTTWPSWAA